jgi:hypothetical protein
MRSQQPLLPSCDDDAAEVEEDADSDDDERGSKEVVVSPSPLVAKGTEVATASVESAAAYDASHCAATASGAALRSIRMICRTMRSSLRCLFARSLSLRSRRRCSSPGATRWYSSIIPANSSREKSGQRVRVKDSCVSELDWKHRKSERRVSPEVRISNEGAAGTKQASSSSSEGWNEDDEEEEEQAVAWAASLSAALQHALAPAAAAAIAAAALSDAMPAEMPV